MRLTASRGIQGLLAIGVFALSLSGCQGNSLVAPDVSSTPVATPIVVSNSPPPGSPTPAGQATPLQVDPKANEVRRKSVEALITGTRRDYPGHSAVVFVDLQNDIRVEFEPEARFESASLVKLIILAELYREFEMGVHTPEEKVVLLEKQKMGGSGHLKEAKEGSQHSLRSLAEAMITESDNTATQMLTDLLGRDKISEGARTLGLSGTTLERDIFDFAAIDQGHDNYITAKDAAAFLQQLAHQELPGSQAMHEILERQKRNDMIGKDFPPGIKLAHKTGELDVILHDAAIVYAPRGAFVLVCLSDQVSDKDAAKKAWAGLALEILKLYSEPTSSPTPGASPKA